MSAPEPEPSVLAELANTDDPLEKAFICLGSVARQCRKIRPWDELAVGGSDD